MTIDELTAKWETSHFWRMGKVFRNADVASYCKCSRHEATKVVRGLPAKKVGGNLYKRTTTHPLAHQQWRKPLESDGKYTPRYF